MDNHSIAVLIDHIQRSVLRAKTMSSSAEVNDICIDCNAKLLELVNILGIDEDLRVLKERRIDPTM